MKSSIVFLFVTVTVIGSAVCVSPTADDGTPGEGVQTRQCSFDTEDAKDNDQSLANIMIGGLGQCVKLQLNASIGSVLTPGHTVEYYRATFKEYCAKVPSIHTCNGNITFEAEVCLNFTEMTTYVWHRDLLDLVMNVFCQDDGERLTSALGENLEFLRLNHRDEVKDCITAVERESDDNNATEYSAITLHRYRMAKSFKECIANIDSEHEAQISSIRSIGDDILKQMLCVGPVGSLMVCEQLDEDTHE